MANKMLWADSPHYKRIIEILEAVPLSEIKMPPVGYKEYTALHINPADYIKKEGK